MLFLETIKTQTVLLKHGTDRKYKLLWKTTAGSGASHTVLLEVATYSCFTLSVGLAFMAANKCTCTNITTHITWHTVVIHEMEDNLHHREFSCKATHICWFNVQQSGTHYNVHNTESVYSVYCFRCGEL